PASEATWTPVDSVSEPSRLGIYWLNDGALPDINPHEITFYIDSDGAVSAGYDAALYKEITVQQWLHHL
ncbi:MAG: hypothetical protein AAF226_18575, partial [Verrucomicrobiota bacterium]